MCCVVFSCLQVHIDPKYTPVMLGQSPICLLTTCSEKEFVWGSDEAAGLRHGGGS